MQGIKIEKLELEQQASKPSNKHFISLSCYTWHYLITTFWESNIPKGSIIEAPPPHLNLVLF